MLRKVQLYRDQLNIIQPHQKTCTMQTTLRNPPPHTHTHTPTYRKQANLRREKERKKLHNCILEMNYVLWKFKVQ